MTDARFEDGAERALRLRAETPEDLAVISALTQDALAEVKDAAWTPKRRRFSVLLTRFRWEDAAAARREGRPFGGSLARWQLRPGAKRQVTWSAMPRAMAAYAPCSSARDRPARRRDPSCAREKARDQTATAGNDGRSCLRARR